MGCGRYIAWLSARLDGELTAREAQELEAHLAQCPACRALASQLAAMHDSFEGLEDIPAPEGFARRVMEQIRAQGEPEKKVVPLFRRPQFRALAGLAACLVLCVGVYQSGVFFRAEEAVDYEMAVAAAPNGGGESMERTMDAPQGYGAVEGDTPMLSTYSAMPENAQLAIQSDGVEEKAAYQAAGQAVSAILTLSQLPQGWEEALGADVEWLTDEEGHRCCLVTAERMEALEELAREQDDIMASLTSAPAESGTLCAVVIAEG